MVSWHFDGKDPKKDNGRHLPIMLMNFGRQETNKTDDETFFLKFGSSVFKESR